MERTKSRSFSTKGRTNSVDFQKLQPLSREAARAEKERYPCDANAYELGAQIGKGASAVVYKATCKVTQEVIALKLLNLEKFGANLDIIIKETATMHDQRHPSVLPLYCSFVSGDNLWMVMPFLSGGSVMKLLHTVASEGFDEVAVASILKPTLEGLNYMHQHGRIHRDIKAENILIDDAGKVMLADFGVAATLERSDSLSSSASVLASHPSLDSNSPTGVLDGVPSSSSSSSGSLKSQGSMQRDPSWSHKQYLARNTFCGTPCFMAPEVMEQTIGYDFSADIWSFGITLYELATGKAPLANMSLTQVILTTVHDESPVLPNKNGRKYSDALQDLIARCLSKDPADRPSAAELLKHRFWKIGRDADYLHKNVLQPALAGGVQISDKPNRLIDRVKSLRTMHSGHAKPPSKAMSFPAHSQGASPGRQGSGSVDTTMSGDVANAIALLKKLTKISTKKKNAKPFLQQSVLQDCKGICFCIIHKHQNLCAVTGKGNGFMIAKQSAKQNGKSDTSRRQWTAPCYFDIDVGDLNPDFEHDFVELAIVIPDDYAYDCFRVPAAKLGGRCVYTKGAKHCSEVIGYACVEGQCFEWPLDGSHITINDAANARLFGDNVAAGQILDGVVQAPCEFEALYKPLSTMATPTQNRSEQALLHIEDQGATMLFRMPHWLYD